MAGPSAPSYSSPAGQARHVTERGAGGEEARDLEVRVEPGLRPAQRLEHEPPAQDHRGIALLAGVPPRRERVRVGREGPARGGTEREAAGPAVEAAPGRDRGEDAPGEARVVVRVHHRRAVEPGHQPPAAASARHGHRDVVAIAVDVEEQQDERAVRVERRPVPHRERADPAGLGREPALANQVLGEVGAAGAREQRDDRAGVRAGRPRCHRAARRTAAAAGGTSSSRRGRG